MTFTWCQAGSHVTNTNNSQLSDFPLLDIFLHQIMIPGISQIQVYRRNEVCVFCHFYDFPLIFHCICNWFFWNNVFAVTNSFFYLFHPWVSQSEKSDYLHTFILKNLLIIFYYNRVRGKLFSQLTWCRIGITNISNIPPITFSHRFPVESSHPTKTDNSNFNSRVYWRLRVHN